MKGYQPIVFEQLYRTVEGRRHLTLGLPKPGGSRSALTLLTPEGVGMLVSQGIDVVIEKDFGGSIHYPDERYCRSGARVGSRAETFGCDFVLFSGCIDSDEAGLLKPHGILMTLCGNRRLSPQTIEQLLFRKVTVFNLEKVRDRRGFYPLSDILGEVSGRAAIAAATSFLSNPKLGKGILLGGVAGVNPCEVVILGTGMAALAAARSVIGLGGMVRLFDGDPYALRTAINELGPAVIGSTLHPGVLGHALASADVVVASQLNHSFVVGDNVLESMKTGVLIFDLNDHDGISGIFPTLKCVNAVDAIDAKMEVGATLCLINPVTVAPRTAAMAITNDIIPVVNRLVGAGHGILNALKTDSGLRTSISLYKGRIVNRELADRLGMRWVDINLLLSFS